MSWIRGSPHPRIAVVIVGDNQPENSGECGLRTCIGCDFGCFVGWLVVGIHVFYLFFLHWAV
jgi:hypothetical protein